MHEPLRTSPNTLIEVGAALDAVAAALREATGVAAVGCVGIYLPGSGWQTTGSGWQTTESAGHVIASALAALDAVAEEIDRVVTGLRSTASAYVAADNRGDQRQRVLVR